MSFIQPPTSAAEKAMKLREDIFDAIAWAMYGEVNERPTVVVITELYGITEGVRMDPAQMDACSRATDRVVKKIPPPTLLIAGGIPNPPFSARSGKDLHFLGWCRPGDLENATTRKDLLGDGFTLAISTVPTTEHSKEMWST